MENKLSVAFTGLTEQSVAYIDPHLVILFLICSRIFDCGFLLFGSLSLGILAGLSFSGFFQKVFAFISAWGARRDHPGLS